LENFLYQDLPSSRERAKVVAQDPVAAAQFFHAVVTLLLEELLKVDGFGCLGEVSAYYGTVEAQVNSNLVVAH
jgi:hypothetical protein